ncbi:MAG: hypothetical protein N2445_02325 [Acidobacteria bacterium]|nr:hypothetical protein [Acidobacteriota bacterium]
MERKQDKIRFVLVSPRSPGNIGSSARVLKNFGFSNLFLVNPHFHRKRDEEGKETYFEKEARRMAYKSEDIFERAKIFNVFEEAVSDCSLVIGTDPNPPSFSKIVSPEEAAEAIAEENCKTAVIFGTESDGMSKHQISLCSCMIKIPTDQNFVDLNLSHSLAIVAYSIFRKIETFQNIYEEEKPSIKLLDELTADLIEIGRKSQFIKDKDREMENELRNIFIKQNLSLRSAGLLRSFAKRIKSKFNDFT